MAELLQAIALLCMVPNGNAHMHYAKREQLKCHKYYVECFLKTKQTPKGAASCILNRPKDV